MVASILPMKIACGASSIASLNVLMTMTSTLEWATVRRSRDVWPRQRLGRRWLTDMDPAACYVTVGQASVLYAVAGQGGSPDVVDVLLRAGAELRPFDGRTALHAALANGHEEVATAHS